MIDDLAFAQSLADISDDIGQSRFTAQDFAVRAKSDGSAVTDVDVQIEETLVAQVGAARPADAFLSEELGQALGSSRARRRWIVDGIDGTAAFVEGAPTWGTLIALEADGEIQVGVISSPGLRRRWWASRGDGAWTAALPADGVDLQPRRMSVSNSDQLRGVTLPPAGLLDGWRDEAVHTAIRYLSPTDSPGHGPLLVAAGKLDASVHLWGGPWDHAPFVVLIEEAGGRFTDLWGERRIDTATALFSNGRRHDQLQRAVAAAAPRNPDVAIEE